MSSTGFGKIPTSFEFLQATHLHLNLSTRYLMQEVLLSKRELYNLSLLLVELKRKDNKATQAVGQKDHKKGRYQKRY